MSKDERFLAIFGQTMREFRTARGYSQYQLANVSGCSRRHINRIEVGDQEARISTLYKLAQALDISLADIGAALDKRLSGAYEESEPPLLASTALIANVVDDHMCLGRSVRRTDARLKKVFTE